MNNRRKLYQLVEDENFVKEVNLRHGRIREPRIAE